MEKIYSIREADMQMLLNILNSSVKAQELGAAIKDAGAEDDGFVTVSPTDNGAGPAPQLGQKQESWRRVCWGRKGLELHSQFLEGVLWIESELGINPDYLMACMMFESGLDPKARNPQSSASGLIQFMSQTAKELGTTIEKIREMDAMTQLSYVYKYFRRFGTELHNWDLGDVYMAILWPKAIGKPANYHLFTQGEAAYKVNAGLDANKDGFITKLEASARVLKLYYQGLNKENMAEVQVAG